MIQFLPPAQTLDVFGFAEVTIRLQQPILDPFRTVEVTGSFGIDTEQPTFCQGFCDTQDGSTFRIRFMPTKAGTYNYSVIVKYENTIAKTKGSFTAVEAGRKGLLQIDTDYPFHFQYSGTKEHFFWNATTAYLLAGCSDAEIVYSIERLARIGINRIRVSLCPSRQKDGGRWHESQVKPDEHFTFSYSPWLETQPDNQQNAGWDITRFDVHYWQKFERLLHSAQKNNIIVQVIFFTDGQEAYNYPFDRDFIGSNPEEQRYYQYAAARLAAFENVEWCVTNEWALFRPDEWANILGNFLSEQDPYDHLMSVHGHGHFPFRQSRWADFALFQSWDEHGGYAFMLKNRREQLEIGRPIPQINEEYGYEDHYPQSWGGARNATARCGDNRRKLAWEIYMAGCYQTTGESAANGLGGWINGRGDDSMTMLAGYAKIKEFFTRFDWWKLEPNTQVAHGAMCLAEMGKRYVVYLPIGGHSILSLPLGTYNVSWYNPRTGETTEVTTVRGIAYQSPNAPDNEDWVLHLVKT